MIDEQSLTDLRERIAVSKDFSPDERTLILDCMNLGDYSDRHDYPPDHGPGSDPWATAAWQVLDKLTPGKLTNRDRWMLGGMLAGAFAQMFEMGKKASGAEPTVYDPGNTAGQIDALYAALSVDDGGEGICAGPIGQFGISPLVCAERRHVPMIADVARKVASLTGKHVRIVRFTLREDVEIL